jgi:hypothetical protein
MKKENTHSSRIQLPTDTPPQLIPPTRLPAILSRLGLPSVFRFGFFIEIGFAPPKESCLPLPILESYPLIIADVLESGSAVFKKLGIF